MENIVVHPITLETKLHQKMTLLKYGFECAKSDQEKIDFLTEEIRKRFVADIYREEFDSKRDNQIKLLNYVEIKIDETIETVSELEEIMYEIKKDIKEYTHEELMNHIYSSSETIHALSADLYKIMDKF